MKNHYTLLILPAAFCSCKTQLLYINVVQPAPVTLPAYIKSTGVINRSLPSDQARKVDIIDKVLSLEGANLDKEGAEAMNHAPSNHKQRTNLYQINQKNNLPPQYEKL